VSPKATIFETRLLAGYFSHFRLKTVANKGLYQKRVAAEGWSG
jgi:hypothetical protein